MTRDAARAEILRAVNKFTLAFRRANAAKTRRVLPAARMYGSRHIQEAVCLARSRRLVSNDVLVAAGFNANRTVA